MAGLNAKSFIIVAFVLAIDFIVQTALASKLTSPFGVITATSLAIGVVYMAARALRKHGFQKFGTQDLGLPAFLAILHAGSHYFFSMVVFTGTTVLDVGPQLASMAVVAISALVMEIWQ